MTLPQTAPPVHVAREPVAGECAACGAARLSRYPVLAENGWEMVVKCQECLTSRSREPWHRLGGIEV